MAPTQCKQHRKPGPLTPDEESAMLYADHCPVCTKPNVFRRPWREDWYCGWCRSVFKMVGEVIHSGILEIK